MFVRAHYRPTGFSLIEMLVVISIVALLMALLMPAITKVRANTVSASCQNGLHAMSVGMATYAAGWKGNFPHRYGVEPGSGGYSGFCVQAPYVSNPDGSPNPVGGGWYGQAPYTAADVRNYPTGIGCLVWSELLNLDGMWCPGTRNNDTTRITYNSGTVDIEPTWDTSGSMYQSDYTWWNRRQFFLQPAIRPFMQYAWVGLVESPWGDPATGKDGCGWMPRDTDPTTDFGSGTYPAVNNANGWFGCTYVWRGVRGYGWVNEDWTYGWAGGDQLPGAPAGVTNLVKQEHPKAAKLVEFVDLDGGNHYALQGANCAWGDGSVHFFKDPHFWRNRFSAYGAGHTGGYHVYTPWYFSTSDGVPASTFGPIYGYPQWSNNTYWSHTGQGVLVKAQLLGQGGPPAWGRP